MKLKVKYFRGWQKPYNKKATVTYFAAQTNSSEIFYEVGTFKLLIKNNSPEQGVIQKKYRDSTESIK